MLFWHGHRALARVTCGRLGLWRPKPDGWGALRLTTAGRRTGRPRQVLVGYVEDGRNLVTMAMNGWGAAEPAWWLNLQAIPRHRPDPRRSTTVRARRAQGDERERLWSRWAQIDQNLDGRRSSVPIPMPGADVVLPAVPRRVVSRNARAVLQFGGQVVLLEGDGQPATSQASAQRPDEIPSPSIPADAINAVLNRRASTEPSWRLAITSSERGTSRV